MGLVIIISFICGLIAIPTLGLIVYIGNKFIKNYKYNYKDTIKISILKKNFGLILSTIGYVGILFTILSMLKLILSASSF